MKADKFFRLLEQYHAEALAISKRKNHDYATGDDSSADALQNFKLCEYLGVCSTETGILVRMCDKISRMAKLLKSNAAVSDESLDDTAADMANYSNIFRIARHERRDSK